MTFKETRSRAIIKTIAWRIFATLNSYIVLVMSLSQDNLLNAIYMNITGFFVFFLFERACNKISWGRFSIGGENDNKF